MEDGVGVLVPARVLATHGCLSADDLAQVIGPSAAVVPDAARAVEPAGERAVDEWERKLRRLFSELVAMEQLLLALALPGTHEGMAWGLRALGTAMPRRCRRVMLGMLSVPPSEHERRWPELHRGRAYKNRAALAAQNRRRALRAVEACCSQEELQSLWAQMLEARPSFESIARVEAARAQGQPGGEDGEEGRPEHWSSGKTMLSGVGMWHSEQT